MSWNNNQLQQYAVGTESKYNNILMMSEYIFTGIFPSHYRPREHLSISLDFFCSEFDWFGRRNYRTAPSAKVKLRSNISINHAWKVPQPKTCEWKIINLPCFNLLSLPKELNDIVSGERPAGGWVIGMAGGGFNNRVIGINIALITDNCCNCDHLPLHEKNCFQTDLEKGLNRPQAEN